MKNRIGWNRNQIADFMQKFGTTLVLLLVCIIMSVSAESFLTKSNILNVMRQTSYTTVVAFAMTLLFIGGMTDLSPGAVMAFTGIFAANLMGNLGVAMPVAILAMLLLGALVGLINGLVITQFDLPPFIVTMAMQTAARGAALAVTKGYTVTGLSAEFKFLGQGVLFNILPVPLLLVIILGILTWIILNKTSTGRHIYAVGGNHFAAEAAGIHIKRLKVGLMVYSGVFAAIAGLILTARLGVGQPNMADGVEFDAMTAVVIGGTSMSGGTGTIYGTVIGSLFMGVLGNMLNILGVDAYYQQIVRGVIITAAICLDAVSKRRRK